VYAILCVDEGGHESEALMSFLIRRERILTTLPLLVHFKPLCIQILLRSVFLPHTNLPKHAAAETQLPENHSPPNIPHGMLQQILSAFTTTAPIYPFEHLIPLERAATEHIPVRHEGSV